MDKYAGASELWQTYHISSAADIDKYLDSFRILFAFHSGKIENEDITYHNTREIFENGLVLNYTGNPRTLFEQQNQKLCYEVLKDKIIKRTSLMRPCKSTTRMRNCLPCMNFSNTKSKRHGKKQWLSLTM